MEPVKASDYVKPTVGRIVHYVAQDGHHFAAIVTAVENPSDMAPNGWAPLPEGNVHLRIFALRWGVPAATNQRTGVPHDEDHSPGTWHWPERA